MDDLEVCCVGPRGVLSGRNMICIGLSEHGAWGIRVCALHLEFPHESRCLMQDMDMKQGRCSTMMRESQG